MAKRKKTYQQILIRIPPEHATKLHWLSQDKGVSLAQLLRNLVATAVRDAKPPVDAKSPEILATADEWSAWEKLAAAKNTTAVALVRRLMRRLTETNAG